MLLPVHIPLKTISETNASQREHWSVKNRRYKAQSAETTLALRHAWGPMVGTWTTPCTITLTRIAPRALDGVGFFISPLPEAGGGEGEGEELGVVAGPAHPHPDPPPSRGREKKGRFRKNLPQKVPGPWMGTTSRRHWRLSGTRSPAG